jgi:uncharacterized protein with GYD domain
MPSYLIQVAYTSEAVAAFIAKPQDRTEHISKVVEKLGGTPGKLYLSFGDYDVTGIYEMPDNVSAAAFALAISAGGACKGVKTTPLLSTEEGLAAQKKAANSGYKPVTKK